MAGKLRHRIIVEVKTASVGTTGEPLETWATHLSVRAAVEPAIGREYFQAYQEQSENMVKFRVRYSTSIGALNPSDHRILFNSNYYDIVSVINIETANKEVIIMTRLHNG